MVLTSDFPKILNRFKIYLGETMLRDSLLLNTKNVQILQAIGYS